MKFILPFNGSSLSPEINTDLHSLFSISFSLWHLLATCYILVILLGFLGNCMVLYAFPVPGVLKKKNVQYILMMNLAMVDNLIILMQGLPTVGVMFADKWPFRSGICHVLALIKHTVFYMKLCSVLLLAVHKGYTMICPFKSLSLKKEQSTKTVALFWAISFLLNIFGLIGSDSTTFSAKFLSCNAEIYLSKSLNWAGYLLLTILGVAALTLLISLLIISWVARGIRVRRLARQANIARPPITRLQRFKNFLRRNKSIASVVIICTIFIVTTIPVFSVHLLKWTSVSVTPAFILFSELFTMINAILNAAIYAVLFHNFMQFYRERLPRFYSSVMDQCVHRKN